MRGRRQTRRALRVGAEKTFSCVCVRQAPKTIGFGGKHFAGLGSKACPELGSMADFKLNVDDANKATELPLLRICGTVQQNPHMRAFWGSTISFFLAFLGWFALAPLGVEVATSINMCENQKFPAR